MFGYTPSEPQTPYIASQPNDAYANCERRCNHDLAQGVLVGDLLAADGPYPTPVIKIDPGSGAAMLHPG